MVGSRTAECFIAIISNLTTTLFYRWGSQDTERLSELPMVTQLQGGETRKGLVGQSYTSKLWPGLSIQSDCPLDTVQAKCVSKGLEIRIPGLPLAD